MLNQGLCPHNPKIYLVLREGPRVGGTSYPEPFIQDPLQQGIRVLRSSQPSSPFPIPDGPPYLALIPLGLAHILQP